MKQASTKRSKDKVKKGDSTLTRSKKSESGSSSHQRTKSGDKHMESSPRLETSDRRKRLDKSAERERSLSRSKSWEQETESSDDRTRLKKTTSPEKKEKEYVTMLRCVNRFEDTEVHVLLFRVNWYPPRRKRNVCMFMLFAYKIAHRSRSPAIERTGAGEPQ